MSPGPFTPPPSSGTVLIPHSVISHLDHCSSSVPVFSPYILCSSSSSQEDSRGFPWWYGIQILCFHCRGRGFRPWSGKFHGPCDAIGGKKDLRMIYLHWNLIMTFSSFTLSLLLVQSDVSRERHTACMETCMWIVGCHKEGGRRWWYLAMKPEFPDVLLHMRYFAQKHKVLYSFTICWFFPECVYLALCFILNHSKCCLTF